MPKEIIWFTSPSCSPCKTLVPKARKLAAEADVPLVTVDITDDPKGIAEFYEIQKVPTIVVRGTGVPVVKLQPTDYPWRKVRELVLEALGLQ